jgi:hypothetical protein
MDVPYREVEHEEPTDDYPEGFDFIFGMGHVRDETFYGWESEAARKAWWAERKRKDEARKKLGGFGLGTHRLT